MLIDETGRKKGILARGEHKSIQTDRVTLVPGPDDEIAIVDQIFHSFVEDGRSESEIAADLNARGIKTDLDRNWSQAVVRQILTNEKYIGNNIWNRNSFKLKKRHVRNDPTNWVRSVGAFEAIVSADLFAAAGAIIGSRLHRMSDAEMPQPCPRAARIKAGSAVCSGPTVLWVSSPTETMDTSRSTSGCVASIRRLFRISFLALKVGVDWSNVTLNQTYLPSTMSLRFQS